MSAKARLLTHIAGSLADTQSINIRSKQILYQQKLGATNLTRSEIGISNKRTTSIAIQTRVEYRVKISPFIIQLSEDALVNSWGSEGAPN